MVRYWLRDAARGWRATRARQRRRRAPRPGVVDAVVDLDEVRRGSLARHRRDPAARARDVSACGGTTRASRAACAPGRTRSSRRPPSPEHDAAARRVDRRRDRQGALRSRARSRRTASARSTCRRAAPIPAIRPRWFQLTAALPPRDARPALGGTRRGARAGLAAAARRVGLRHGHHPGAVQPAIARSQQATRPLEFALKLAPAHRAGRRRSPTSRRCGESANRCPSARRARARLRRRTRPRCAPSTTPATLGIADTRAVHFAFNDEEAAAKSAASGSPQGPRMPLEVHEAPYRDIGEPLLAYLRELTADEETDVLVDHAGARSSAAGGGCCTTSARST